MPVPADEERINGRILSHRFTDIDRFTEQVQSFSKVRMTQLSVEGLRCDLLLAAFREAQFAFVKSSCPILTLGEKPRNAIIFSCILELTGPYIISHNRKISHHTLAGFDPDVEVKFVMPQDVHFVSLQINRDVLQDYLNVMERTDLDERFWASNYVQVPETIATVTAYLQQILHLIQHQPHLLQQSPKKHPYGQQAEA